ncbi:hypothetical protein C8F04DRAFT_1277919 [Mycena alexandri]|uniref:Uncharacterized protein n=1 Tax=Mycena alexandri TaxID=1745969 RepID=A0AAD6S3G9_9AGAR|nr:hypothetical protein C8F04DRAFT_1277919 [Mycena alexandri]
MSVVEEAIAQRKTFAKRTIWELRKDAAALEFVDHVVRVTRGQFTGCIGLILQIGLGGSLEIWDAERSDNSNSENPSDEVQAQLLPDRSRNVELVEYQMAAYSAPYTRTSEVGARPHAETVSDKPDPEREHVRQQIINLGQRLNDYNADDDLYMSNIAKLSEKMAIPLTAADVHDIARVPKNLGLPLTVHERDQRLKDTELKFAYTGHRFEGIDVKIIRGANKGVQRVVFADHDSAARVERLAKKRRRGQDRNAKGIILTVCEEVSNQRILVPIEDAQHLYSQTVVHKPLYLPEAVLKGKQPKRQPPPQVVDDVYLQGPLEPVTQNGYLLAVDGVECNGDKIVVRGLGKTAVPVSVPPACVKPRRTDDDGKRLNEVQMHVVVVGPDSVGSTAEKGKYGFTIPAFSTAELVDVQFPDRILRGRFPYASLCLAKNVAIQSLTPGAKIVADGCHVP